MSRVKFGVCEFSFPCWGPLALQMAHEAGFTGMQLADAGGSTNAYPLNNKRVQDSYLEAAAKYGITLQSIHLYTLVRQSYIRFSQNSPEGRECMESIKNGIIAASQMGIPVVMIEGMRMYGAAQYKHVYQMYQYAVKVAEDYGVQIAMETDIRLEDHFKFLDKFDGKLKLCFDTHNPVMYGTGYPPRYDPGPGQGAHQPFPHEGIPGRRRGLHHQGDRPHRPAGRGQHPLQGGCSGH